MGYLLLVAIGFTVLLTLISTLSLLRYRRMSKLLAKRTHLLQQKQQALQDAYKQQKTLSQTDSLTGLVARYGGEEFACLLTDTSPEDSLKVAKRISHEIAKLSLPNASVSPPYLTLSIGLATIIEE